MKPFLGILIIGAFLIQTSFGQTEKDISSSIEVAIKVGNAKELTKLFCNSIDLNIPGNEGVYSKAQSELILRDFFTKNNPKSYTTLHKGSSKDGAKYSIGSLITEKGTYRTYFYMKQKGDSYIIHEFSLNSEEKDRK